MSTVLEPQIGHGVNDLTDQSMASFRAELLDSLFDGVYFVDRNRKIRYWNRGAENLTGYSAPEAVSWHCSWMWTEWRYRFSLSVAAH